MRRVVVLLALGALTACGATDAVRTAAQSPVPALEVSAAPSVEPQPEEPVPTATPSAAASPSPAPPSPPPPPSPAPAPSPSPEPLRECHRLPPPVPSDVEAVLTLPERVDRDTVGRLRLTNRGAEPVQTSGNRFTSAVVVRGSSALSTGAGPAIAYAPITLPPGESRDVQVRLATATCGRDRTYVDDGLPPGTYDVVSSFIVGEQQVTSAPVRIRYAP